MFKNILAASLLALPLLAGAAFADAIEGEWLRPNGIVVKIAKCGGEFCVTPVSGKHKGEDAGKMAPKGGGKYAGSLTDLEAGKTYTGKGSIIGDSLSMSGCVFGGLFCKSENWARQ